MLCRYVYIDLLLITGKWFFFYVLVFTAVIDVV